VKVPEEYVAIKPKSMSFDVAASVPLVAMTALQALRKYDSSLSGKTTFIPAGCM
jgi:NADPH:quinone reductase-like Zn-dependent oxidoreductase